MKLHIAICDDDPIFTKKMERLLISLSFKLDIDMNIDTFSDGSSLLDAVSSATAFPYQLLFLDVEMPGENGIELAHSLYRIMPSSSFLVFVSSYPEYMQESFSVHPFSYLTKPVRIPDLERLLADILERYLKDHVFLVAASKEGKEYTIPIKEIIYMQISDSRRRDILVFSERGAYTCRGSLSDLEQAYPDILFRLNRSILINLFHIHYIDGNKVVMSNEIALSSSIRSRRQLVKILQNNPGLSR